MAELKKSGREIVLDKAMEGTGQGDVFRGSEINQFIKEQNEKTKGELEVSLSKTALDFLQKGPVPVVDLTDAGPPSVSDSITLTNTSRNRKIYFEVKWKHNPKYSLTVSPICGELKKGQAQTVVFDLKTFCTCKVYQMLKISLYLTKPSGFSGSKKSSSFFGGSSKQDKGKGEKVKLEKAHVEAIAPDEDARFFVVYKIESELSSYIDHDDLMYDEEKDLIAKGGFGTVYRGKWKEAEVAIKILNTQEMVEEERAMVMREIRLMSKLNFSYIVTYMGSTVIPGQPLAIVMEYVNGGSLTKLLETHPGLSDRFKCKLALDVAKGMAFLHSHSIYHRDLKPDNMLVATPHTDAQVNLKITDFGTSRTAGRQRPTDSGAAPNVLYESVQTLTQARLTGAADTKAPPVPETREQMRLTKGVGTLAYQAPEILEGRLDYDVGKTDVYSFGVLLWQVFVQCEPYSQPPYDKLDRWAIENFVRDGKRLKIPDTVPRKVTELINKCWHKVASERPTFPWVVQRLQQLMDELPDTAASSPQMAVARPSLSSQQSTVSGGPVSPAGGIPTPKGNTDLIGWSFDISRPEAESRLRDKAVGTFLIRWSSNSNSYVLSYVASVNPLSFQHIAFIKPVGRDMKIEVDKEDGTKQKYDNIYAYCDAMKETGVIKDPVTTKIVEDTYGFTPLRK